MTGNWLRRPKAEAGSTTVVFVHGLLSNDKDCWRHRNGSYWPELLSQETKLQATGIYVFNYLTAIISGQYNLDDVVDSLKEQLRLDEVINSGRLVFVCHSMGGIVVRKYIIQQAGVFIETGKEVGVFLVASPSLGSDYANWLESLVTILGHSQGDVLKFRQNNVWLNDLNKQFRNLLEERRLLLFGKELIEDKFVVLRQFFRKQIVEPFSGAAYFGDPYKVPNSDHFSIVKPEDNKAIQHRLLCQFIEDKGRTGVDLSAVRESHGELRTVVSGCEIRVVNGRIEQIPRTSNCAIVLPCNEYFDDECADDLRSALGAYVNDVFRGQISEFKSLVASECRKTLGRTTMRQKTKDVQAESFGPGRCVLLTTPLGNSTPIALVSTTTQRAGQGLVAQISFLFNGMRELFERLADKRISEVTMPILGAGHGGIGPPLALVGLLLALAEAAHYGQGGHRTRIVTLVVFKRDAESTAEVDPIVVRRALALIGSKGR